MEGNLYELDFEDYLTQKLIWPKDGQRIIAQYTQDTIVLYQAYSKEISGPAIMHQDFITENPNFSIGRMTWVKPNFLWMMFRSDWGSKKNQETILAFFVNRFWFELCIKEAALSGKDKNCKQRNVVVQWDPDHTPGGGKHKARKAIQIGLRKLRSEEWAQGTKGPAIRKILDITDFVHQANETRIARDNFLMPKERIYPFEAHNIQLI